MTPKTFTGLLNGMFIVDASPKVQAVVGGALVTTPVWAYLAALAQGITMLASTIAAVCGAIIGVRGVCKIFRR